MSYILHPHFGVGRWAMRRCVLFGTLFWAGNTDGNLSMSINPGLNEQIKASRGTGREFSVSVTLQHPDALAVLR